MVRCQETEILKCNTSQEGLFDDLGSKSKPCWIYFFHGTFSSRYWLAFHLCHAQHGAPVEFCSWLDGNYLIWVTGSKQPGENGKIQEKGCHFDECNEEKSPGKETVISKEARLRNPPGFSLLLRRFLKPPHWLPKGSK